MTPLDRWLVEHVPPYSWQLPTFWEDLIELTILVCVLFVLVAGVRLIFKSRRRR